MSKAKMIELSKDMIGKRVRCINKFDFYHPKKGTTGIIVDFDLKDTNWSYMVLWEKGSTHGDDRWWAENSCIELVEDNEVEVKQEISDMTDEEIWEFLKRKMDKIGLKPIFTEGLLFDNEPIKYNESDVKRAIVTAYRSGYLRSQKGRPFKIGDKKGN